MMPAVVIGGAVMTRSRVAVAVVVLLHDATPAQEEQDEEKGKEGFHVSVDNDKVS